MRIEVKDPEAVAKEALWLAWQACGGPTGMGVVKDNPSADKEQVWQAVRGDEDRSDIVFRDFMNRPGDRLYADYVFGRMMKLGIEWNADSITVDDAEPRRDYQSWCVKYPTYADLIAAATAS